MKVYVFDLDGTLAESKGPIDGQMKRMLKKLLRTKTVCVISGGGWPQFQQQLINQLDFRDTDLSELHCFPTCGTSYYAYTGKDWKPIYKMDLTQDEKDDILSAFDVAFVETDFDPDTVQGGEDWGEIIEDRGSQITFSALGQKAPYDFKKVWDPTREVRQNMIDIMQPLLPNFDVRLGGTTSIDITRKGCNKSLAIRKIEEHICNREHMVFFGDALEPGGNDHAVYQEGVLCVPVKDHIDCVWKIHQFYEMDRK